MSDSPRSDEEDLSEGSDSSVSLHQIDPKIQCIVTDPRAVRILILHQHLQGIPVFNAYKAMNKVFGDHFMEYRHFEYWYMGLANGSLTVDSYDRFHTSERKEFTDFSTYFQAMILDKLNPIDRFAARAVCRGFKSMIDYQHSNLKTMTMYLEEKSVGLKTNGGYVTYELEDEDCQVNYKKRKMIVKDKKPLEVAMKDVSRLLKIRGLDMDYFAIIMTEIMEEEFVSFDAINDVLKSIGILSAKSVLLDWFHTFEITVLLKYFKPGILEDLTIKCLESDEEFTGNLVYLEQWKKAKNLKLSKVPNFPIIVEHLDNFKSLNFDFHGEPFSRDDIMKLRDEVLLKSTKFEYFSCKNVKFNTKMFVKVFDARSTLFCSSGSIVYESSNGIFDIAYHPNGFNIKKKIDSQV
ncbi:F-box domain-containing protein [Caenorhabditis elegans]|uniref:F-box domain-containing protein n=1 Tax=Caenorhabditis elegans TaxID=6239 RepID=O16525_CAEEL|nr:F-box domain-containing protein [Caenorhabditis elegans]CCD72029.1 F-box domain-containing protein [Caenorhabditis elegans]|eukprot:NP_504642.1 F-box A protein [Caenorhabditis elegans]